MYDVHVFAVVRVKVKDIEAKTTKEATEKAIEKVDWRSLFMLREGKVGATSIEFTDEFNGFMVNPQWESDGAEFLREDGSPDIKDTCHRCKQTAKPSISLDLLKAILFRENSVIDEGDVQGMMTVIRREANNERRGKKTALAEEIG